MNILFVCTGNTCRSCMAEAIFNHKCNIHNINAKSAGIAVLPGSKASKNSSSVVLSQLSADISGREAVQLTEKHLNNADLILTMTSNIRDILSSKFPQLKNRIFTINEYVGVKGDIIDPYGGNISVYEETFFELNKSIELLLDKLKEDRAF